MIFFGQLLQWMLVGGGQVVGYFGQLFGDVDVQGQVGVVDEVVQLCDVVG